MKRVVFCLLVLSALSACETMKGAGRDVQNAGDTITTEADKTQKQM